MLVLNSLLLYFSAQEKESKGKLIDDNSPGGFKIVFTELNNVIAFFIKVFIV